MIIKLETSSPDIPDPMISSDTVDKKPVIVVRADEAQLTVLNASFAKTSLPNKAQMDEICKETRLYVFF
jgi:hypothetical protein